MLETYLAIGDRCLRIVRDNTGLYGVPHRYVRWSRRKQAYASASADAGRAGSGRPHHIARGRAY